MSSPDSPVRITPNELALVLAGLFELHITRAEDEATRAAIHELVRKIGGDPEAAFFGAFNKRREETNAPAPKYSADEIDKSFWGDDNEGAAPKH
jgi:hypothetical protein